MSQSRRHSMIEAWTNVLVGYWVAVGANFVILPLFGFRVTARANLVIALFFTAVSLVRSYLLRRLFNRWHSTPPQGETLR